MKTILQNIHKDLKAASDKKTKESGKTFFKEEIKSHGVKIPQVVKIGRENYSKIKDKSKKDIFFICEELFKTGFIEEAIIACNYSYNINKQFEPKDFKIFEKWMEKYVTNWAVCDTFCNHTMGIFLDYFPEFVENIKKWTKSKNRWVRRASAVSFIVPATRGKFLHDVFDIANSLITDPDDLVQKGYGWALKVAANKHQKEVYNYVMEHKNRMPRTALRYAIEKMPPDLKIKAMEK